MAIETQDHPNRLNALKIELCSTLSLSKGLPCVAFCDAGSSTSVENALQINSFMQNKPNFQDCRINLKSCKKKAYENKSNWTLGENKPNSNPNKPNLRKAKMNVNSLITKDYRKKDDFASEQNKPNSNPIQTQSKPVLSAVEWANFQKNSILKGAK